MSFRPISIRSGTGSAAVRLLGLPPLNSHERDGARSSVGVSHCAGCEAIIRADSASCRRTKQPPVPRTAFCVPAGGRRWPTSDTSGPDALSPQAGLGALVH